MLIYMYLYMTYTYIVVNVLARSVSDCNKNVCWYYLKMII